GPTSPTTSSSSGSSGSSMASRCWSAPGEASRALLGERRDTLGEVLRARHLLLDPRLELQLGVHLLVEPPVELALGPRVRPRRAVREPLQQLAGPGGELFVRPDPVDQPPLERLLGAEPLAEHGQLGRSGEPDP